MEPLTQLPRSRAFPGEVIALGRRSRHRGENHDASAAVRVLVAERDPLMRAGLRAILEADRGIAVVADAATGDDALALAARHRPEMALIDIDLPGLDALEAARRMLEAPELEHVKLLVLIGAGTGAGADAELLAALRAGANGVLVKDGDATALRHAIHVVAQGGAQLSPSLTRRLIDELASQPDPRLPAPEALDELTARELEVLSLVAMGLTNGEIAEWLVISPTTAKTHVSRTMVKLHAHDRAKLVRVAYESGLVRPRGARSRAAAVALD